MYMCVCVLTSYTSGKPHYQVNSSLNYVWDTPLKSVVYAPI